MQSLESDLSVDAGSKTGSGKELVPLVLGALGVVYGDIGTSPLYAVRECFNPDHGVALSVGSIFGVLSLVFWSLTLVVMVKYLFVVLHADNEGEGGILALLALVMRKKDSRPNTGRNLLILLGLCGTALLVADGMITPAISVLSAIEGLEVATPVFRPAVVPITVVILIALFLVQRHGTAAIGSVFGPIMCIWFLSIAALGIPWIAREPGVLMALNPVYAVRFFIEHRLHGLVVLGAVVLCVTGCEALYADMGHFGRKPIAFAWMAIVFPCILLNYFGQGAVLLHQGAAALHNPFYSLAPGWLLYPVVALATAATVIASQALISGTFSLAQQAMQLDYFPRLTVMHTSRKIHGQIYIPEINATLALACVALVIGFRTSSNLAAAYGIAVVGTMATTSLLMFAVERQQWGWRLWQALGVTVFFLALDLLFLVGNVAKIFHGGWFPLAAGGGVLAILTTWKRGSQVINHKEVSAAVPLDDFIRTFNPDRVPRVKGTALFIMGYPDIVPRSLLHHLKHNKVLHEQVVLLYVGVENVPFVPSARRLEVEDLGRGFLKVNAHCGFMQSLDMREILKHIEDGGVKLAGEVTYYIGHMTVRPSGRTPMRPWRKALFAFLFNNERSPTTLLGIPPNRVVELGEQTEF
jgi:KUP system potassium uptake protein